MVPTEAITTPEKSIIAIRQKKTVQEMPVGYEPVAGRFKVTKYGSNENKAYQAFVNAGYPINDNWSLYTFGGVSKKEITAYGFFP
ncbi:MAG: hypothetical protein WKF59_14405 [Chitinophagaceae bacterium]